MNFVSSMCAAPRSEDQFVLAKYKMVHISREET